MSAIPLAQLAEDVARRILVNNAGTVDAEPAIDEPLERSADVLSVDLVAPSALAQRAAKAMLDSERGVRSSTSPRSSGCAEWARSPSRVRRLQGRDREPDARARRRPALSRERRQQLRHGPDPGGR